MAIKDLNKTIYKNPTELQKTRKWYKVDATGMTLGKLAVIVADLLIGKNEGHYCDFWDCGAFVVVENAGKVVVSGKKLSQKMYYTYSGWKGNVKSKNLQTLLTKKPMDPLYFAVRGMLPKNTMRDSRMKRMKMFTTASTKYDFLHPIMITK
jgi:large subunit ribosomal protein L13